MRKILILVLAFIFIFYCKSGIKSNPSEKKAQMIRSHINKGLIWLNQGKLKMAEGEFRFVLTKKPDEIDAQLGMGIICLSRKDFKNSEIYLKRALALNPDYLDIYNYLGIVYTEMGKYELAKEMLLKPANSKDYRTSENSYLNLCLLELKRNDVNAALRYANAGLKENKRFAPLFNIKGIIYKRRKEYENAIFYFEKAIGLLKTSNVSCLMNLGESYFKLHKYEKALTTLERALGVAKFPQTKEKIRTMIKTIQDRM